ncbi:MAG: trypsin-like peptidase domain-containing protein [Dehalococcoidia bacterium]
MTDHQSNELGALSNGLASAVERAAASTVLVAARRHVPASGVVWSDDGLVVTADHAIEFEDDITVRLPDGSEVTAQLVGRDPSSDLALLRIAGGVPPAVLTPAGSAKVGHLALAVARPSAAGPQASLGIISAIAGPGGERRGRRGRTRQPAPARLEGYLRADVTFFPGFSGGPLVDVEGRVLGINVSLIGGPRMFRFARGAFGQGFTVDAASVTRTVELLKTHGRVRRAYLGVASQPVTLAEPAASAAGQAEGLLIVGVEGGTPAAQGGLLVGDILVGIEDAPVRDADDLQRALTPERVGEAVRLQLIRGGAAHELSVTLGARE